jgi:nucleotide-binding universal stress UspA family protein
MRILAATDFSTRSNRAVRQAGLLAHACHAPLYILHVVDDDLPARMLRMEKREAERILSEQTQAMAELRDVQCHVLVATGDPFDGILRTAASCNADLIVMGQHRRQLLRDIFVGTTIERVIRAGPFPVLMVNNEAQRRYERIVIAVDMSDSSVNAIRTARTVGLLDDSRPTLLHAFDAPAKGKLRLVDAEPAAIEDYVDDERRRVTAELAAFMAAHGLEHEGWPLQVQEGLTGEVLSRSVEQMQPDLLVMGTRSRASLLKVLLGSVAEEALRALEVDILAVPPAR